MAITRETLDHMGCSVEGCKQKHGEFYFHSRCHPESPTWTKYENGVATILCAECRTVIAELAVASQPN